MAVEAKRNLIPGTCGGCALPVAPGAGWWVPALSGIRCEPCLTVDADRHRLQETKRFAGAPPPKSERNRVRLFWAGGRNVAVASIFNPTAEGLESFYALCQRVGFDRKSDIGRTGPVDLVPELCDALEERHFVFDMSDVLADELLRVAAELRSKSIAGGIQAATDQRVMDHQRIGIEWMAPKRFAILADDGGLGKTMILLKAAPPNVRMNVVCPSAMKGAMIDGVPCGGWADEAKRWRPDLRISILEGMGSFRWAEPGELVITNYDILPPTPEQNAKKKQQALKKAKKAGVEYEKPDLPPPATPPPDGVLLVGDEAHFVAGDSKRADRFALLCFMVQQTPTGCTWGATATPMKNVEEELWAVLAIFGCAIRAFGSRANYARMHNATLEEVARNKSRWVLGHPTPEVAERLKNVMLRRRKRDVLKDLPPLTFKRLVVQVDRDTIAACDAAMAEMNRAGVSLEEAMDLVEETTDSELDFSIISKAVEALARAKTPAALEYADELERTGTPSVFFSMNTAPVKVLAEREGWGVISGQLTGHRFQGTFNRLDQVEVVDRFQRGEINHVASMIQMSGVGITLTRASTAVLVSKAWNPAANTQAIWRIDRIGQKNPMTAIDFLANHPLDWHMSAVLEKKLATYAASVDAASVSLEDIHRRTDAGARFERSARHRLVRPT